MMNDSAQISDPGSIIYIPGTEATSLHAQGVSTYSLTGLKMDVVPSEVCENDLPTYLAITTYNNYPCYFRDFGFGLTAGFGDKPKTRWWIEPVNAGSIDTSFLGVKPVNEAVQDAEGWYWTSICCDYPFLLPVDGGVEGAYTVTEVKMGEDGLYYAEPVKVFGQGEIVTAATPVLLKCKAAYASGNKVVPVGDIANHTAMPIVNDLLMGNYFSNFTNRSSYKDDTAFIEYIPEQATFGGLPIGKRYLQDAMAVDIYDVIDGYDGDVLIIHGSDDEIVPRAYSERAAQVYGTKAELVVLGGMRHGFRNSLPQHYHRLIDLAVSFCVEKGQSLPNA